VGPASDEAGVGVGFGTLFWPPWGPFPPGRRTGCLPPPRRGGRDREGAHNKIRAGHPLPNPPPRAGEGADRDRGDEHYLGPRFRGDERMKLFDYISTTPIDYATWLC